MTATAHALDVIWGFPSSMPSACKASGGNITCSSLSFNGDTLVFENPMTLAINGDLSVSQTSINAGSSAITFGGNIVGGTGKIALGDSSSITDTITSTTGDVSLSNSVESGGIASASGDISIGYKTTISGAVIITSGFINFVNEATLYR